MRTLLLWLFVGASLSAQTPPSPTPADQATSTQEPVQPQGGDPSNVPALSARPVGTVSELMVRIIYPYSEAIFHIGYTRPTTQRQWDELHGKALMLAESANLLMMPGRSRDQDQWISDSKLLLDAGTAAVKAAKNKDVKALV